MANTQRKDGVVKKLVILLMAAVAGLLVWRKVQADRAEQDLWTEATSTPEV